VSHVARRAVTIDQTQRGRAGVGELVKNARGDIHCLSRPQRLTFSAEAHLTVSFYDKIDFFLFLVVPRDLPPAGFQGHHSH
jgi:hypothetical protein